MNRASIVWEYNADHLAHYGLVNGKCLFKIDFTGVRSLRHRLSSFPIKGTIFVGGNTSKLLHEIKSTDMSECEMNVNLLKSWAEEELDEYLEIFTVKPLLYKVKLLTPEHIQSDKIFNGYLKDWTGAEQPAVYTRGEAIKKARMFNGKIEKA